MLHSVIRFVSQKLGACKPNSVKVYNSLLTKDVVASVQELFAVLLSSLSKKFVRQWRSQAKEVLLHVRALRILKRVN
uniref:Uncharacterized protein n=1 Tax=Amphimedon queenslandica TaxID=400682 RepID=A0A1X7UBW5_AMPQE